MSFIIAVVISSFGFVFLFTNWKNKSANSNTLTPLSWLLIISGSIILLLPDGIEFGLVYALFGLCLIPLSVCITNLEIHTANTRSFQLRRPIEKYSYPNKQRMLRNAGLFTVCVPIAFVVSLLSMLVVSNLLSIAFSWSTVNELATVILVFPFLWALLFYLTLYLQHTLRWCISIIISGLGLSICMFL